MGTRKIRRIKTQEGGPSGCTFTFHKVFSIRFSQKLLFSVYPYYKAEKGVFEKFPKAVIFIPNGFYTKTSILFSLKSSLFVLKLFAENRLKIWAVYNKIHLFCFYTVLIWELSLVELGINKMGFLWY